MKIKSLKSITPPQADGVYAAAYSVYVKTKLIDDYPAVFGWTNQMIDQNANIVAFVDVDAHASILTPWPFAASGGVKP